MTCKIFHLLFCSILDLFLSTQIFLLKRYGINKFFIFSLYSFTNSINQLLNLWCQKFSPSPFLLPSPTLFPLFFLLNFPLLQAQVPPHRVCHLPFMSCLFSRLMRLLDWTVSKLDLCPSIWFTSTHAPSLRTPAPPQQYLLLLILATLWRVVTCMHLCVIFSRSGHNHSTAFLQWYFVGFCVFSLFFPIFCSSSLLGWERK